MPSPAIAQPPPPTTRLTVTPTSAPQHWNFRQFLSELNPLQYIPVLGTIYRAVTGDTIPETAREAGSLVVSGLTGGPIGVAINLVMLAAEKITGVDPEKLGSEALAGIGIGAHKSHPAAPKTAAPPPAAPASTPASETAWSPAQLAAYGISKTASGDLRQGMLSNSDVLNSLELTRHKA